MKNILGLITTIAFAFICVAQEPPRKDGKGGGKGSGPKIAKPRISDTVRANIYADNWFKLYINGNLVAVDSISFIPHNVVSVDWFKIDFDDSDWGSAVEHSEESVGPKGPYYENDFKGAKWIWTKDLALDNTVVFRKLIPSPPNGSPMPREWPRGVIDASERK